MRTLRRLVFPSELAEWERIPRLAWPSCQLGRCRVRALSEPGVLGPDPSRHHANHPVGNWARVVKLSLCCEIELVL
jgi:hypothetical protein